MMKERTEARYAKMLQTIRGARESIGNPDFVELADRAPIAYVESGDFVPDEDVNELFVTAFWNVIDPEEIGLEETPIHPASQYAECLDCVYRVSTTLHNATVAKSIGVSWRAMDTFLSSMMAPDSDFPGIYRDERESMRKRFRDLVEEWNDDAPGEDRATAPSPP